MFHQRWHTLQRASEYVQSEEIRHGMHRLGLACAIVIKLSVREQDCGTLSTLNTHKEVARSPHLPFISVKSLKGSEEVLLDET